VSSLPFIVPDWPAPANVRAASTLRGGGVSVGPYSSLNLAAHVGDSAAAVSENRRLLRQALRLPTEPFWLDQVHGSTVVEAGASAPASAMRADASIARAPGRVCAVMTADCLPVLLCSRDGDRVAAAHAGWRGLAGGILDSTVASLGLPGEELLAWLGPAIGPAAFEVGDEVRVAFLARDSGHAEGFRTNARGRWMADLYMLARRELAYLGVRAVYGGEGSGWCCFSDESRFFSYRRDGQTGRMATLIWREE